MKIGRSQQDPWANIDSARVFIHANGPQLHVWATTGVEASFNVETVPAGTQTYHWNGIPALVDAWTQAGCVPAEVVERTDYDPQDHLSMASDAAAPEG